MVTIEPISESHLDLVYKYASDKSISDTSNVPHPYTREMAHGWFKAIRERQEAGLAEVFAITHNGNFAGVVSLNNISLESEKADVDYWVAVEFQGKGIATAAVAELVKYASKEFGINTFFSGSLARNIGSRKVQEKNGFRVVKQYQLEEGKFAGEAYILSRLVYWVSDDESLN